ncbi:MAG: GatB/YqeY domain-containing protein, partial [Candidatus Paceibacterota bacterium]
LFVKGGRNDLADQAKKEIDILLRYLPKQLEEGEIKKIVAEAVAQAGASSVKDMGKVMVLLMPKVKGRADCALVVKLAKEALG